jgi:hypothetical protein
MEENKLTSDNNSINTACDAPFKDSNSIELLTALLSGKTIIKKHSFGNTEELLCEVVQDGRKYFYIRGWGTAYGNAQDRIMDIIQHPEKWSIELQNDERSVATEAK